MLKKLNYKYITIGILAVLAVLVVPTHATQAQSWFPSWLLSAGDFILYLIDPVIQFAFTLAAYFVQAMGALLNISINLTMNIRAFVANNDGIYFVWQTLRDLSGIILIFMLLYASFKLILSQEEGEVMKWIKNAIIAGILINFSFFFVGLLIDASNVVSLSIYSAISPSTSRCLGSNGPGTTQYVSCAAKEFIGVEGKDQGISGVIINALKITKLPTASTNGSEMADKFLRYFLQIVSIVTLVVTALSFAVAAGAFVVRLITLLFLLAASPLWFASMIFPGISEATSWFTKTLKTQLLFMPAYLLTMYVALRIAIGFTGITGSALAFSDNKNTALVGLIVSLMNYAFVIIAINAPLFVAVTLGGISSKYSKGITAQAIFGKVGKATGSWLGRNTIGAAANRFQNSEAMRSFAASSPNLARLVNNQVGKVSSASFGGKKGGYDAAQKEKQKQQEKLYEQIGKIDRSKYATEAAANAAQEAAKVKQRGYVENLDRRSPLNIMKDRANRQTAYKLDTDANAKQYQDEYKELIEQLTELKESLNPEAISDLQEQISQLKTKAVLSKGSEEVKYKEQITGLEERMSRLQSIAQKGQAQIQQDIKIAESKQVELKAKVDRINKAKQDKETSGLLKKLKDLDEKPAEKTEKKDDKKDDKNK